MSSAFIFVLSIALLSFFLPLAIPAAGAATPLQPPFHDRYKLTTQTLRVALTRRQAGGQGGGAEQPQFSDNQGADVENNQTAATQDQQDEQANDAADQGVEIQAIGGVGGVDPATGETLLALPQPSAFCTSSGQELADGTQKSGGFCSSIPQGQIPSVDRMVSSLILQPQFNDNFAVGQGFTVRVQTRNMQTGFFTVAASEYYTQPQTLNSQGIIKGHTHVTIQRLASLTEAPDANQKDFFKGLNDAADGSGVLSTDVPANTLNTPGIYRICTMAGAFSHQPVVMPIAQRGAQDDCIRINVGDNGGNDGAGNGAANGGNNGAANGDNNGAANGANNGAANGANNGTANGGNNGNANGGDNGGANTGNNANRAGRGNNNGNGGGGGNNNGRGNGGNRNGMGNGNGGGGGNNNGRGNGGNRNGMGNGNGGGNGRNSNGRGGGLTRLLNGLLGRSGNRGRK